MSISHNNTLWDRRAWLAGQVRTLATVVTARAVNVTPANAGRRRLSMSHRTAAHAAQIAQQSERLDPASWQTLAQQAVDAARSAGAQYADARLTRVVQHEYGFSVDPRSKDFREGKELIGVSVRALVNGYWGFSASAMPVVDEIVRLAQDAVAQARDNAQGPPRTVDLGHYPVATGTWATPIRIDPFTISMEEKEDFFLYWGQFADPVGVEIDSLSSWLRFARHEQVVASSEGALFTQTTYETGGELQCRLKAQYNVTSILIHGIDVAGAGWERLLDAKIPEQFTLGRITQELEQKIALLSAQKPTTVGRYTVVCDGATMAALAHRTLGVATQLDRAMGYEANAGGTSFLDDPLAMVGHAKIASPMVTLTANRSAPMELATVKWDAEGVEPEPFTLVKNGVLTDFQTTREQAAWLAPYYQQQGRPIRSHGCANAEDAHGIPMQMLPNLSLEPNASAVRLEDLIADVPSGILLEGGTILQIDSQARTGILMPGTYGAMREIKNGRVGKMLAGGAILFNSHDLWNAVTALGGPATQMVVPRFYPTTEKALFAGDGHNWLDRKMDGKGQPRQATSCSIRSVAATLPNQPLINPSGKA